MEYIKGALAILSVPFFIGAMLLAAFWERDSEEVQKQEKPREQGQQGQRPIPEVDNQPNVPPAVMKGEMTEGGGYSIEKQQNVKTHRDEERRKRKKRRR